MAYGSDCNCVKVTFAMFALGASDKSDNSTRYLERPVNKLVVLVENNN